jgi:hypothetical protein
MDNEFDFSKVAFVVDNEGHKKAAVLPIELYEQLLALRELVNGVVKSETDSSTGNTDHPEITFKFEVKQAKAEGYPVGIKRKPEFVVKQGSSANGAQAGSLRPAIRELRQKLLSEGILFKEGGIYTFVHDYRFNSPSASACLIAGNPRSGLDAWLDDKGRSLKALGFGKKR